MKLWTLDVALIQLSPTWPSPFDKVDFLALARPVHRSTLSIRVLYSFSLVKIEICRLPNLTIKNTVMTICNLQVGHYWPHTVPRPSPEHKTTDPLTVRFRATCELSCVQKTKQSLIQLWTMKCSELNWEVFQTAVVWPIIFQGVKQIKVWHSMARTQTVEENEGYDLVERKY